MGHFGNWDGHLPSDKMEREILFASEGIEDEDGNPISTQITPGEYDGEEYHFGPSHSQTGPKGVKHDKKMSDRRDAMQRKANAVQRQEVARMMSARGLMPTQAPAGEDEDEEEDDAFKEYRLARLKQMQKTAQRKAVLPTFGSLVPLSIEDYVACVDGAHAESFVVIHLCETLLPACVRLNFRLQELAKQYDQVKFCVAIASEVTQSATILDGLPTLVAYHGGRYLESEARAIACSGPRPRAPRPGRAPLSRHAACALYAMLCYAMPCYAMPCYAMPCYAMLCYAMLCYVQARVHEALGDEMELGGVASLLGGMGVELSAALAMREARLAPRPSPPRRARAPPVRPRRIWTRRCSLVIFCMPLTQVDTALLARQRDLRADDEGSGGESEDDEPARPPPRYRRGAPQESDDDEDDDF